MRVILSGVVFAGVVTGAVFGFGIGAAPAFGQSVAQIGGPAELPPAGFSGQQYVDSRGCVFMRAGFAGRTTWVPRIGSDRKAICSAVTPAQAAARLSQPEAIMAGAVGAPLRTVASDLRPMAGTGVIAPMIVPGLSGAGDAILTAPAGAVAVPAPQIAAATTTTATITTPTGPALGCPATAPVLQSVPLRGGGVVAVCTKGDGTTAGWISPRYAPNAAPGAALRAAGQEYAANGAAPERGVHVQTVIAGTPITAKPRAPVQYEAAWQDDRLNPLRGLGTQAGWARQAQVLTNTVPAQDVAQLEAKAAARKARSAETAKLAVSSRSYAPAAPVPVPAGGAQIYVQVGTFGQPSNAQNAAGRLAGMGLPVATSRGIRAGQELVAIMAGPFVSAAQAQSALGAVRSAGFRDAFLR